MTEPELQSDVGLRFTEEQWQRISNELGPNAPNVRAALEMWAGELIYFRQRRREWDAFSPTEEQKRLLRIANLADTLLSEIRRSERYGVQFASRVIGGWTSIEDDEDEDGGEDVETALAEECCLLGPPGKCVGGAAAGWIKARGGMSVRASSTGCRNRYPLRPATPASAIASG